jgi:MFS family permease
VTKRTITANGWSLFLGIALLQAGVGLQRPLLGLRAEDAGFSTLTASLVMTLYYAGFIVGTRFVGHALAKVGHIRTFAGLASTASSIVLLQGLWISPISWGLCRLTFGVCCAALYVVAESWLNDLATNESRGRILSVYTVIAVGATMGGQYSIGFAATSGFTLFAVASVMVSMALVPIALSSRTAPPVAVPEPFSLRALYSIVPTGIVVCFLSGMSLGIIIGLGPVYGAANGWGAIQIANFVGAPLLGSVLLQIPLGRLSDRLPRRSVLTAASAGAAAMSFVMLTINGSGLVPMVCLALMGGMAFPIYSITVAYINDWLRTEQMTGAAALLVRVHGVGAFVGPLLATPAMGASLKMYFCIPAVIFVVMTGYLIYRIFLHDAPSVEDQGRFQPFPLRASRMVVALLYRRRR